MGCHFLFQGIFPTGGSNPGLPHCGQTLYRLSHQRIINLNEFVFSTPRPISEKQQQKKPSDGIGPLKGDPIYSSFFPGPPFTPPSPKAFLPVTRSRKHPLHPTRKLLFKDFLPSPAKPGALAIRRGSRCSLFSKKNRNCHFRGKKKKELDEAFWGSKTRAERGGGEESPARPIASPALSPPLRLRPRPVPPPQPLRLGPAPLPRPRPSASAPPPRPSPPASALRLGPAPPPQPRRLGPPLHLSPAPPPRLGPAPSAPPPAPPRGLGSAQPHLLGRHATPPPGQVPAHDLVFGGRRREAAGGAVCAAEGEGGGEGEQALSRAAAAR